MFFLTTLGILWGLIALQGLTSYCNGYFRPEQMISRGINNGYSFLEHAGMWADFFIVSPLVSYVMWKYKDIPYLSVRGMWILVAILVGWMFAVYQYQQISITTPEAHAHYGQTTLAGWIHLLYAVFTMWVIVLVYISPLNMRIPRWELILGALLLCVWADLGVKKFNPSWEMNKNTGNQVAIEFILIWLATFGRIMLQR